MSDGQVVIDIVGDAARFQRAVSSIGKDTERALASAGSAVSAIGGGITASVTVPLAGMGAAAVKTATDFLSLRESAQTAFTTMLGSGEAASAMITDLYAFAKKTPFAFDGMLESSQQLISMGMEASKVIPTLTAVGDAAAASGKGQEGFANITRALGKMQAQGQVALDDLWSLSDNGVSALQILANKAGKSVDEMKEDISAGAVESEWAIQALVEGIEEGTDGMAGQTARMGGLMAELKNTFKGACDSMRSSVRNFGLALVGEFGTTDQASSKFLGTLTRIVQQATALVDAVAAKWSEAGLTIEPAFAAVGDALERLVGAVQEMEPEQFERVVKAVAGLAAAGPLLVGFGKALQIMAPAAGALAGAIGSVAGALGTGASKAAGFAGKITGAAIPAVKDFAKSMAHGLIPESAFDTAKRLSTDLAYGFRDSKADIADAFAGAKDAIASRFSGVSEAVGTKLGPIKDKVSGLTSVFGESARNAADTFAAKLGLGLDRGGEVAKSALGKVGGAAGTMAKGLATATGVLGGVATGLLGLGLAAAAGGADLQKMADDFTANMQAMTQNLPVIAAQAAQILPQLVQTVVANLPAFLSAITSALGTIVEILPVILPSLIDGVVMIITQLAGMLVTLAPQLLEAGMQLFTSLLLALAEAAPAIAEQLPVLVQTLSTVLIENLPLLLEAGLTLFLALVEAFLEMLPQLIDSLPQLIDQVTSKIGEFLPRLGEAAGKLFEMIVKAVPKIAESLLSAVGDLIGKLPGKVKEFVSRMGEAGENLIKGVANGIADAGQWVLDKIGSICNDALGAVKSFFGIASPSKLMAKMGRFIGLGLANGIGETAKAAEGAVGALAAGIADAAAKAAPAIEVPVEIDWPKDARWPAGGVGALLGRMDVTHVLEATGRSAPQPAPQPATDEDGGVGRIVEAVDRLTERVGALDAGLGRKIADNAPDEVSIAPGGMRAARRALGVV